MLQRFSQHGQDRLAEHRCLAGIVRPCALASIKSSASSHCRSGKKESRPILQSSKSPRCTDDDLIFSTTLQFFHIKSTSECTYGDGGFRYVEAQTLKHRHVDLLVLRQPSGEFGCCRLVRRTFIERTGHHCQESILRCAISGGG